jgi:hypothetical protein
MTHTPYVANYHYFSKDVVVWEITLAGEILMKGECTHDAWSATVDFINKSLIAFEHKRQQRSLSN